MRKRIYRSGNGLEFVIREAEEDEPELPDEIEVGGDDDEEDDRKSVSFDDSGDGTTKTFTHNVGERIDIGTVEIRAGDLKVIDDDDGDLVGDIDEDEPNEIDHRTGDITVTFSDPPDEGESITLKYAAFESVPDSYGTALGKFDRKSKEEKLAKAQAGELEHARDVMGFVETAMQGLADEMKLLKLKLIIDKTFEDREEQELLQGKIEKKWRSALRKKKRTTNTVFKHLTKGTISDKLINQIAKSVKFYYEYSTLGLLDREQAEATAIDAAEYIANNLGIFRETGLPRETAEQYARLAGNIAFIKFWYDTEEKEVKEFMYNEFQPALAAAYGERYATGDVAKEHRKRKKRALAHHKNVVKLLPRYEDAEVTDEERNYIQQHLAYCDKCKEELLELRAERGEAIKKGTEALKAYHRRGAPTEREVIHLLRGHPEEDVRPSEIDILRKRRSEVYRRYTVSQQELDGIEKQIDQLEDQRVRMQADDNWDDESEKEYRDNIEQLNNQKEEKTAEHVELYNELERLKQQLVNAEKSIGKAYNVDAKQQYEREERRKRERRQEEESENRVNIYDSNEVLSYLNELKVEYPADKVMPQEDQLTIANIFKEYRGIDADKIMKNLFELMYGKRYLLDNGDITSLLLKYSNVQSNVSDQDIEMAAHWNITIEDDMNALRYAVDNVDALLGSWGIDAETITKETPDIEDIDELELEVKGEEEKELDIPEATEGIRKNFKDMFMYSRREDPSALLPVEFSRIDVPTVSDEPGLVSENLPKVNDTIPVSDEAYRNITDKISDLLNPPVGQTEDIETKKKGFDFYAKAFLDILENYTTRNKRILKLFHMYDKEREQMAAILITGGRPDKIAKIYRNIYGDAMKIADSMAIHSLEHDSVDRSNVVNTVQRAEQRTDELEREVAGLDIRLGEIAAALEDKSIDETTREELEETKLDVLGEKQKLQDLIAYYTTAKEKLAEATIIAAEKKKETLKDILQNDNIDDLLSELAIRIQHINKIRQGIGISGAAHLLDVIDYAEIEAAKDTGLFEGVGQAKEMYDAFNKFVNQSGELRKIGELQNKLRGPESKELSDAEREQIKHELESTKRMYTHSYRDIESVIYELDEINKIDDPSMKQKHLHKLYGDLAKAGIRIKDLEEIKKINDAIDEVDDERKVEQLRELFAEKLSQIRRKQITNLKGKPGELLQLHMARLFKPIAYNIVPISEGYRRIVRIRTSKLNDLFQKTYASLKGEDNMIEDLDTAYKQDSRQWNEHFIDSEATPGPKGTPVIEDPLNGLGSLKSIAVGSASRSAEDWQKHGYWNNQKRIQRKVRSKLISLLNRLFGVGNWGIEELEAINIDPSIIPGALPREQRALKKRTLKKRMPGEKEEEEEEEEEEDFELPINNLDSTSKLYTESRKKREKIKGDIEEEWEKLWETHEMRPLQGRTDYITDYRKDKNINRRKDLEATLSEGFKMREKLLEHVAVLGDVSLVEIENRILNLQSKLDDTNDRIHELAAEILEEKTALAGKDYRKLARKVKQVSKLQKEQEKIADKIKSIQDAIDSGDKDAIKGEAEKKKLEIELDNKRSEEEDLDKFLSIYTITGEDVDRISRKNRTLRGLRRDARDIRDEIKTLKNESVNLTHHILSKRDRPRDIETKYLGKDVEVEDMIKEYRWFSNALRVVKSTNSKIERYEKKLEGRIKLEEIMGYTTEDFKSLEKGKVDDQKIGNNLMLINDIQYLAGDYFVGEHEPLDIPHVATKDGKLITSNRISDKIIISKFDPRWMFDISDSYRFKSNADIARETYHIILEACLKQLMMIITDVMLFMRGMGKMHPRASGFVTNYEWRSDMAVARKVRKKRTGKRKMSRRDLAARDEMINQDFYSKRQKNATTINRLLSGLHVGSETAKKEVMEKLGKLSPNEILEMRYLLKSAKKLGRKGDESEHLEDSIEVLKNEYNEREKQTDEVVDILKGHGEVINPEELITSLSGRPSGAIKGALARIRDEIRKKSSEIDETKKHKAMEVFRLYGDKIPKGISTEGISREALSSLPKSVLVNEFGESKYLTIDRGKYGLGYPGIYTYQSALATLEAELKYHEGERDKISEKIGEVEKGSKEHQKLSKQLEDVKRIIRTIKNDLRKTRISYSKSKDRIDSLSNDLSKLYMEKDALGERRKSLMKITSELGIKESTVRRLERGDLVEIYNVIDAPYLNGLAGYVCDVINENNVKVAFFKNDIVEDKAAYFSYSELYPYYIDKQRRHHMN